MPDFHPGFSHGHTPAGRWSEVQKNPNSPNAPFALETLCKLREPEDLIWWASMRIWDNPLAQRHIDWYLKGSGADFNENAALKIVMEKDDGIRSAIGRRLPNGQTSGKVTDYFKLEQKQYGLDDARTAWGAIDRFDYEADYDAGTLHVWFKDRYEWHPYYPGMYSALADDAPARETNCLHAAFVEMKSKCAADFWMVGEATVALKGIPGYTLGGNLPDW
jgi:hypothetical protein